MMMKGYLREDLKGIKPYQTEKHKCTLKLDANESPYPIPLEIRAQLASELLNGNDYHQYPDPNADRLRDLLAEIHQLNRDNILIGNGSDELLHIITTAFAGWGDKVLCPLPGFSMVSYYARLAGAVPVDYRLNDRFQYDVSEIEKALDTYKPKILHICSPNNPTGSTLPVSDIYYLARRFDGVVVVDEAYYEFCGKSAVSLIHLCPNLVVLRTFSKAIGIAGLRVGYMISSKSLANEIYKAKPPYNVNSFSQRAAELMLAHPEIQRERVKKIIEARDWLYQALDGLRGVDPYPSEANFILFKVKQGDLVYRGLLEKGIVVRHFEGSPILKNHLRITIGRAEDNKYIIQSLADILANLEGW
ncbi:MAG TPA: histidinol-phosphate transaminase [Clostridiales bacterium]|nr:histidinol-phosphate transaminase [Clostridiales bacterium]